MTLPKSKTPTILWTPALLLSLLIMIGGWWISSVNTGIAKGAQDVQVVTTQHMGEQKNLDIINAKLDVILKFLAAPYNGPEYKSTPTPSR